MVTLTWVDFKLNLHYMNSAQQSESHSVSEQLRAKMDPYIGALMEDGVEEVLAQTQDGKRTF